MQQLPYKMFDFCIRLLDHLEDPDLNRVKMFLHSPSAASSPIRIKIQTNHLDYYTKSDFQFQLLLERDEIKIWCCCLDINSFSSKYFFYQYHINDGEVIEGNISSVEDWLDSNFKSGYFREMLFIQSTIPEWE
jgi:hypothetical protein